MVRSIKILTSILVIGAVYSLFRAFTGQGGSGLYDFFDAMTYSSIVLFLTALIILLLNLKRLKDFWPAFIFLLLGLPLTAGYVRGTIEEIKYKRTPDLSVKYKMPVSREQYLFDSTNIKLSIDSLIAMKNRKYGGPDILYGTIDTIIYSETGDKVFVSFMEKVEPNNRGNDIYPNFLVADSRDSVCWQLKGVGYSLSGGFHDIETLKKAVRKFYFNQFSFLDKDSTSKNYFWKVVL